MEKYRYIASCNFTLFYPELSVRIQNFLKNAGLEIIRCCAQGFSLAELLFGNI